MSFKFCVQSLSFKDNQQFIENDRLLVKKQQFYECLVIGKKRHISSNETSPLWQNILTAKRNAWQNNLLLLVGLAAKVLGEIIFIYRNSIVIVSNIFSCFEYRSVRTPLTLKMTAIFELVSSCLQLVRFLSHKINQRRFLRSRKRFGVFGISLCLHKNKMTTTLFNVNKI